MNITTIKKLEIIDNLESLVCYYDAFIIDLWGVVHDGFTAYPGVVKCINNLIVQNKIIIFLSNAPLPNKMMLEQLLAMQVNVTMDMLLTSGEASRLFLKELAINSPAKKYYHLGEHRNPQLLADLNLNLTDNFKEADLILLTAYIEEDEDLNEFDHILKQAGILQIPMICSNPDLIAIHGGKNRYCAGFLAEKYKKFGGKVHYYGKPYLEIYDLALQRLQHQGVVNKERILMIGDTIETDLQGAINAHIDSALVLTGNTGKLIKNKKYNNLSQLESLEKLFMEYNVFPNHILKSLN